MKQGEHDVVVASDRRVKEKKKGARESMARRAFCAQVLHLNQIKEPFQLLKEHFFAFNKGWTAVAIKHMVLRRCSFVPGKPLRY